MEAKSDSSVDILLKQGVWIKAQGRPPLPVGDCRKLVWLRDRDGMEWCGIRAYNHAEGCWMVSGVREESATVTHWMNLPDPPQPHWMKPDGETGDGAKTTPESE